jgi:fumarate reductase subunit C
MERMRRLVPFVLLLAAWFWFGAAAAQDGPADPAAVDPPISDTAALPLDERGWPYGDDPAAVADAAVTAWLERPAPTIADLAGRPAEEVCAALPGLVANPPPAAGTEVRLAERRAADVADPAAEASFTYAAVRPGDVLDVVQVDLTRTEEAWTVARVGFRVDPATTGRPWLQTPTASFAFVVLSALVLLSLLRPGPLRRALARAGETIRLHRRTVVGTMVVLYAVFGLGVLSGTTLPDACGEAVLVVVQDAVGQLGATAAYASGDVARAAVVTFYQNFVVVTFSVHFLLSLLLGAPTYLLAVPQFFLLGVPFGLLGGASPLALLPVIALVAIELTAYFLVVSGGGIVLGTLFRRGFGAYPEAVRRAASLLVPSGLLLLFGAWYEAIVLILGGI